MFRLCGLYLTGFLVILIGLQITAKSQGRGSSSVSGKVTIAGKPAKGVPVTASPNSQAYSPRSSTVSTVTNDEGVYHLTGLAAGNYKIAPYDPSNFLAGGRNAWEAPGKDLSLSADETAENIDFDIARGGVITGRITTPDGKPTVEIQVSLDPVDPKVVLPNKFNNPMYQTDDRGVYRIYGLPAGQYLVSAGEDRNGGSLSFGREKKGFYPRTFYPGSTEKSEAKLIELGMGAEEKDIDIILSPREKTYSISGRVVDEESGKPISGVQLGYGTLSSDGRSFGAAGFSSSMRSDIAGEFKMFGVKPGKYAVFTASNFDTPGSDRTGTPVNVEITDSDVEDLEIKTRPGISIDGIAVLETSTDPSLAAKLSSLSIYGFITSQDSISPPTFKSAQVKPDHTFHLGGLSPGKFTISISNSVTTRGFSIRRVELNGAALPQNSIDLTSGSNITNVRLVLVYGTGTIRGQVNLPTDMPSGTMVWARAVDTQHREFGSRGVQVDARGKFVIENIPAGEYDVLVSSGVGLTGKQTVTVADGAEANVTITLVANPPNPGAGGDRP